MSDTACHSIPSHSHPANTGRIPMEFSVDGMSCSHCVQQVTDAIGKIPGIDTVRVLLDQKRAIVKWKPAAEPNPKTIEEAVAKAGYSASLKRADLTEAKSDWLNQLIFSGWKIPLLLGGPVTGALMLGEWVFRVSMEPWFAWVAFALTLPVQIIVGARFYLGAWKQARIGRSNMDTLVA